jgi:hypothetical protein
MGTNLSGLGIIVAMVALGVAGYAMFEQPAAPADLDARRVAVEDQVARIESLLAERGMDRERAPTLLGLGERPGETPAAARGAAHAAVGEAPSLGDGTAAAQPSPARTSDEIAELVNEAVEKKAAQIQVMQNKKPSIDVFAKTLELSATQRAAAAEQLVRAQQQIKDILEIPAEDGTNFMDELVEVMARGVAEPGKNPGRGVKLFGRLMSETIPGSSETYATRIEKIKQGVRATFRRDWTQEQYATFEAWRMDPTEVQDIEGSPWKDVGRRLLERAKELGADVPDDALK